ncbi:hypothetical protein B0H66DRAFT_531143 [Apodospora peruviana]|uniref:Uncharacterized protein n=1 Tax=Apodospora peruviana TaxID=516989 RepID=A0AAE0IBR7_9PEZI|nr:hypothetical protein B0H66DRAFT_531143 [Apodospora peruviana]
MASRDRNAASRDNMPQSQRQNEYFVPRDGIDREVISSDICRYLGNDALVRPGTYENTRTDCDCAMAHNRQTDPRWKNDAGRATLSQLTENLTSERRAISRYPGSARQPTALQPGEYYASWKKHQNHQDLDKPFGTDPLSYYPKPSPNAPYVPYSSSSSTHQPDRPHRMAALQAIIESNPNSSVDGLGRGIGQDELENTDAEDDTATIYTAAQNLDDYHLNVYESELADGLANWVRKLQPDVSAKEIMADMLPGMLRNFALRLGQHSTTPPEKQTTRKIIMSSKPQELVDKEQLRVSVQTWLEKLADGTGLPDDIPEPPAANLDEQEMAAMPESGWRSPSTSWPGLSRAPTPPNSLEGHTSRVFRPCSWPWTTSTVYLTGIISTTRTGQEYPILRPPTYLLARSRLICSPRDDISWVGALTLARGQVHPMPITTLDGRGYPKLAENLPSKRSRCHVFLFDFSKLKDGSAIEVLLNPDHLRLLLYPSREETHTETITGADGDAKTETKTITSYTTLGNKVEGLCTYLDRMIDHKSQIEHTEEFNSKVRHDPSHLRMATLPANAFSWVELTRIAQAVTLFGKDFGELLAPAMDSARIRCSSLGSVPIRKQYLCDRLADLQNIIEDAGGDISADPILTGAGLVWMNPSVDDPFGPCGACEKGQVNGKHSSPVQQLVPRFWRRIITGSCLNVEYMGDGAVIFGQVYGFEWTWPDSSNKTGK